MGQPDGGRSALGQQSPEEQARGEQARGQSAPGQSAPGQSARGQSLVSQVLVGAAGGRVRVERDLPPGQKVRPDWPAQHYGRVPRFRPDTWTFTVMGATESGTEHRWDWAGITRLPR